MVYASSRVRAGFSFIEIVVALMIIAIMSIGAFSLFRYLESARRTRAQTALENVNLALTTFNSDTGTWPTTLAELHARPTVATVAKRWRGPYLEDQREIEDAWNREFVYHLNPKNSSHPYELYSWGKNGEGSPQEEWISVWDR